MSKHIALVSFFTLYANATCLQLPTPLEIGECYEKEGNTNLAQAAYERAIIKDVNATQARYKLVKLYDTQSIPESKNAVIQGMDKSKLTPAQRTSLVTLQQEPQSHLNLFKARASLNIGYDSNINISPADSIAQDFSDVQSEQSSAFARLRADLSYLHDLGSSGGWFVRSDLNFYYQNNFSAHDYDLTYGRVYVGAGYRREKYTFYLPLYYDRMHYLTKDLLQEYGLHPDFMFKVATDFFINVNANYMQRQYIQSEDTFRNDTMLGGGGGLFWIHKTDMVYLKLLYENYNATENIAAAFTDKERFSTQIGTIYSFVNILDMNVNYLYKHENFKEVSGVKREDSTHDVKAQLKHNFTSYLSISGEYHFTKNDSTYELAKYQKHEMLLGVEYNY